MKTSIENIAKFIAAAVMADGKYDEAEKIALTEIAEVFEISAPALEAAVETAKNEISKVKNLKEYLCVASTEVEPEERNLIFEALLEVVLTDGILTTDEVETLLESADLLAIPQAEAVLMLADMIKDEPETKIEF